MPNRILKESICTSDNLNDLSPQEEIFFYRLIVNCDDYGIADARSKMLRSKCFPLKTDSIKETDIEKWLKALVKANLVFVYEVDGRRYLKMCSWEHHQQIRAKRSKFPLPDSNGYQMISSDDICPRNPIQSNPNPKEVKIKYADNVSMTEKEHHALVEQFGNKGTADRIENLSLYKGSTGKKYASDYLTILAWDRKDKERNKASPKGPNHPQKGGSELAGVTNW